MDKQMDNTVEEQWIKINFFNHLFCPQKHPHVFMSSFHTPQEQNSA